MILLDAFPAEHCKVVGAIEVLNSLVMLIAKQAINYIFIFEINISKNVIPFHNLIKDIKIKR